MRLRSSSVWLLTVGTLAGSTSGALSQDDDLGSTEPAVFVWDIVDGSDTGVTIEASDPRASGRLASTEGESLHLGGQGYAVSQSEGGATLTNDGGSWNGTNQAINAEKSLASQVDRGVGIIDMTGEAMYEGLNLVLFSIGVEGDEDPELWGYIYPADAMAAAE